MRGGRKDERGGTGSGAAAGSGKGRHPALDGQGSGDDRGEDLVALGRHVDLEGGEEGCQHRRGKMEGEKSESLTLSQ